MLTLFTIPKAFVGHIGDIQRNAIKSWTLLRPKCEVILLADDSGTSEVAEELGVSKATLGYWLLKLGINVRRVALAPGETMEVKRIS